MRRSKHGMTQMNGVVLLYPIGIRTHKKFDTKKEALSL